MNKEIRNQERLRMKHHKRAKSATNVRRGRRNRQRGAELQRLLVNKCKELGLDAHNRDMGGAMHEKGDVEIEGEFYGCKRRKRIPTYLMPEKEEIGVVFRGERMPPMISLPLDRFLVMLKIVTGEDNEV